MIRNGREDHDANGLSEFIKGSLGLLFALTFGWGETVGIVHAFRQHGVTDGWAAVFVPPFAYWRGIEFFTHKTAGSAEPQYEWPDLSTQELSVISEISAHSMDKPLSEEDIARYRQVFVRYSDRIGRNITTGDVAVFVALMNLNERYNYELSRCLLMSIDANEPFFSNELISLQQQIMQSGFARKTKLEADFRKLISAGKRTVWIDELGDKYHPLTRQEVLEGLERLEMIKKNYGRLSQVLHELTGNAESPGR